MADDSKKQVDWEKLDETRMELAVREIEKSDNLRFFFRSLLARLGMTGTPDGPDALSMARAIGAHGAGTDLIATLENYSPGLYAGLLGDDSREAQQRKEGAYQ